MKCLNVLVTIGLLALATTSHAARRGGESSGGGTGVVCRDLKGKITQATTLDLYEVASRGTKMKQASGDAKNDFVVLMRELRKASADPRTIPTAVDYVAFNRITDQFRFLSNPIALTMDTGSVSAVIPSGCAIEQIIVADDFNMDFFVNEELWKSLDSMDQASLVVHEFLYQVARLTAVEKTSERVRAIVGGAASARGLENAYEGATPGTSVVCKASELGQHEDSRVVIYDNPNGSVILLTQYFGFLPMHRQAYQVPKIDTSLLVNKATAQGNMLIVNDPTAKLHGQMFLGSKNMTGEKFAVEYTYGLPFSISQLGEGNEALRTAYFSDCHIWDPK